MQSIKNLRKRWNWQQSNLLKVSCPLCTNRDYKLIYSRVDGLDIVSCKTCSFRLIQPQPSQSELNRFYQCGYFSGNHDFHQGDDYFVSRKKAIDTEEVTGWRFLKNRVKISQKRVLDLGCADGALLVLARQHGATKAVGIEVSAETAAYGRKEYGLEILESSADALPFANKTFDVVTGFDLIEHVRNPEQLFKEVYRVLEVGGVFVGGCPDMGCFDDWGAEWPGVRRNMEHLSYFDDYTLSKIAKQSKFQVTLIEYEGFPLELKEYPFFDKAKTSSLIQKALRPNIWIYNIWQKLRVKLKDSNHKHELLFILHKI